MFEHSLREARLLTLNLKGATDKILKGVRDLSALLPNENTCSICFEHKRQYTTNCGHLMCTNCKDKLEADSTPRCFVCRTRVDTIIKVYL